MNVHKAVDRVWQNGFRTKLLELPTHPPSWDGFIASLTNERPPTCSLTLHAITSLLYILLSVSSLMHPSHATSSSPYSVSSTTCPTQLTPQAYTDSLETDNPVSLEPIAFFIRVNNGSRVRGNAFVSLKIIYCLITSIFKEEKTTRNLLGSWWTW